MNPMQNHPHIIELFACTRKMLAIMFLFLINSIFFLEHVQHQNYQNKQFHFCYKIKQFSVYLRLNTHQGLLHMTHPLLFWGNYFFKSPILLHNQLLQFLFFFFPKPTLTIPFPERT